ncbi:MAG: DinB family protein [Acidobacteriia bacterium]|nr:DinB family protein [Terriglobia bacterium]
MHKPQPGEYNPYYEKYISLVPQGDLIATLKSQIDDTRALLSAVPETRGAFRYADGKWSIKEVVGHLIDTERIMSYRALRIARGDTTPLPGFEQDDYVRNANSDAFSLASLADEYAAVRRATTLLFEHMTAEACTRQGTASTYPVTVRALAWIIAGHELHHRAILKERYLNS